MKYTTASKIVEKMIRGIPVKLRGDFTNGISIETWEQITSVLFHDYGCSYVKTKYHTDKVSILVENKLGETIISSYIYLY